MIEISTDFRRSRRAAPISTGTGVELAPIDRELMLGPDGPFVQLNDPLEWPPFEGAPCPP